MNRTDYDKYYQKGGTYVIPVEIFNDLFDNYENLIKYLEDKNKEDDIKANGMPPSSERDELITRARVYRELLERIKNNNYE